MRPRINVLAVAGGLAAILVAVAGCPQSGQGDKPAAGAGSGARSQANPQAAGDAGADRPRAGPQPGSANPAIERQDDDPSLAGLARRAARFVARAVEGHNRRLVSHGLVPAARVGLALRIAPATADSPAKNAMAGRVRELLAEHVSRLPGVELRMPSPRPAGESEADVLDIEITTDFNAATSQAIQVQCTLNLDGERAVHLDRFIGQAVVIVNDPAAGAGRVTVSVSRPDFATDISVLPGQPFVLPAGSYDRIAIRSAGGQSWSPPTRTLGLQNIWQPPGEADPAEQVRRVATSASPAAGERARIEPGAGRDDARPTLVIVAPADGQAVARVVAVSGQAPGLEQAWVQVIVTPAADGVDYVQDGRGRVANARWTVDGVLLGRAGLDRGQAFYVKVRATTADGQVVESSVVRVVRQ